MAGATFSHYGTRHEAETAERTLIASLRPPYNIAGKPLSPTLSLPPPPPEREPTIEVSDDFDEEIGSPISLDD